MGAPYLMGRKFASSPYDESQQVVWHDPTSYDSVKHGPPYLPEARVPLTASQKEAVRSVVVQQVLPKVAHSLVPQLTPLASLLAVLQAAAFIHKTHHWQTSGGQFYADHLLFDRLYTESQDLIDQVAERTVGTDGFGLVDASAQAVTISNLVDQLCEGSVDPNRMVAVSLKTESLVLHAVDLTLSRLRGSGKLTSGTDNLLQGVADQHETFVYLLKQRAPQPSYSYAR